MRIVGGMLALTLLAGCPRPLPEPVAVSLLPLTVEQALPAQVPANAVYVRGNCYFYRTDAGFVSIPTNPAPDIGTRCPDTTL